MIVRIVLGVAFLLCVAMAFMLSYRGRYENTSLVVLWCSMSTITAMALLTREIVSAINKAHGERDVHRESGKRMPVLSSDAIKRAPGLAKRANEAELAPIGQRPGETVEQWAKRVETEEAAAFKAKSRGQS